LIDTGIMSPQTDMLKGENVPENGRTSETQTERRGSLVFDSKLASEEDAAVLAKMGFVQFPCRCDQFTLALLTLLMLSMLTVYLLSRCSYKQELRRNFSMIEVFGIAFAIMGLLPSIASTLSFSIPAGPVGLTWGWFLASGCIFVVGLAMADLGSSMPTSGGKHGHRVVCLDHPKLFRTRGKKCVRQRLNTSIDVQAFVPWRSPRILPLGFHVSSNYP
jgi:hypothetical protein